MLNIKEFIKSCDKDYFFDDYGDFSRHFETFKGVLSEIKSREEVVTFAKVDFSSVLKLREDESVLSVYNVPYDDYCKLLSIKNHLGCSGFSSFRDHTINN